MFDMFEEMQRITRQHCVRMGYPVPSAPLPLQHEHLLRRNHSYWCAYGVDWRQEKAAHERDRPEFDMNLRGRDLL